MPSRSPRAAAGLAYLKRPYNDVDIFVEDTSNHNMWLFMLRNILGPDVRLSSVNQLGGRNNVIEACRRDQGRSGRRRLYIIDGDFDLLLGRRPPRLRHLYRLRYYCVENALIKKDGLNKVALVHAVDMTEGQALRSLNAALWTRSVYQKLQSLFVVYAVAQAVAPQVRTVGSPVTDLLIKSGNSVDICPRKTFRRALAVSKEVKRAVGLTEFKRLRREVAARALKLGGRCISGKAYLAPLLLLRMRATVGFKGSSEQLMTQLAALFSPTWDRGLTSAIRSLLT